MKSFSQHLTGKLLTESPFNKAKMKTTSKSIHHDALEIGRKKSLSMLNFIKKRFDADKENSPHVTYNHPYTQNEESLYQDITRYFKQSLFMGMGDFDKTYKDVLAMLPAR